MRAALALLLLVQISPLDAVAANVAARPAGVRLVALPAAPVTALPGLGSLPALPQLPAGASLPSLPALPSASAPNAAGPSAHPTAPAPTAAAAKLASASGDFRHMAEMAPANGNGNGSEQPGARDVGADRTALDVRFDHAAPSGSGEATPVSGGSSSLPPSLPPAPKGPEAPRSRWRAAVPNLITGLNLTSGLGAALLASQGALLPAAGLILLANLFDALDGRAARLLKVASPIGAELDSLADVVSFGVAPALLIFKAALAPLGIWGFAAAAAFAGAGAFRLARFNLGAYAEREGKAPAHKSDSFTGMPIPGGAGVLVALTLLLPALPAAAAASAAVGVTLLTAGAMASRLPYPAFKKGAAALVPLGLGAALAVPLALLGHALWIPAAVFGVYLAMGPLIWLYKGGSDAFRKELKRKAFHQLSLLYIPGVMLAGAHSKPALIAWTAFIGVVELVRLKAAWARPFFDKWFGGIIRAKEADRLSGSFYVSLGITIAAFIAGGPGLALYAAIVALALGDAASPLVGLRFGWKPYTVAGTQRSVDGTLAGFAVAFTIALAAGCSPLAALTAAAAFSIVDTYPVKPDDNLWIPVVYAAAITLLR